MMKKDYNQLLREKVQIEYDEFIKKLKNLTVEEVIDFAYEKAIKEELLNVCLNTERTQEEANALYSLRYTLGEMYEKWLNMDDSSYDESLNYCIENCANKAIRRLRRERCKDCVCLVASSTNKGEWECDECKMPCELIEHCPEQSMNFQGQREIDIIKQDIRCCDEVEHDLESESLEFTYEMWFDVDKYFGTDTRNSDNWINFYTIYHSNGEITAAYTVVSDDGSDTYEWELTDMEKAFFIGMMKSYCQGKYGKNLVEMLEE